MVLAASTGVSGVGTAVSHGVLAPAAAYLGTKTVVACAAFAVGAVADIARNAIEHAYCEGQITQDQYDIGINLLDGAHTLSTILNGISAIGGDPSALLLGATAKVFGSAPIGECDSVVTDSYVSQSTDGASMMVTYEANDNNVRGTVSVPMSGTFVDSIVRPTYAGFGVLPRFGGLFGDDDLDCMLNFGANGGSWRSGTYLDIRDYIDRGGDFGTLSDFIKRQAERSSVTDRLCREEEMAIGDVFSDRLSRSIEWLGPRLTVVRSGTTDEDGEEELVHPYAIGQHKVTFAEYDRYARATMAKFPDDAGMGRGARPVVNVSAEEASDYVQWLSEETGKLYRLSTAAEWNEARRLSVSRDLNRNAVSLGNGIESDKTLVTSGDINRWEIYAFHGVVREWLSDCTDTNGSDTATDIREAMCSMRRIAGGFPSSSEAGVAGKSALSTEVQAMSVMASSARSDDVGFRVVQDLTRFYGRGASDAASRYAADRDLISLMNVLDAAQE